jgi:5-methylcytosine-specific restriction protein B
LFNKDGKACNQLEKITFHQSFSYEEFIEGIRPKTDEKINQITYPIEEGIFKRLCKCADIHDKENFVLIIDEINRGNISKIFGELITLLENDKRGDTVTLPYSKKLFSVPPNLYIIGTMNTADRSLVHIDAALKRRFAQVELMPNSEMLNAKVGRVHLGKLLDNLNQKIIDAKFRDNQIGHSYFMKNANPITTVKELQFAFVYDIVPLLKDYFYDDDKILNIVLGHEFIDNDRNILSEWTENESVFMKVLEKAYSEAFD